MALPSKMISTADADAERAYLTEAGLGRFLRERLDADIIANSLVPTLTRRFRPDYRSELYKLIVEFDGDQHYQRAIHVLGDAARDALFFAAGYQVIRSRILYNSPSQSSACSSAPS